MATSLSADHLEVVRHLFGLLILFTTVASLCARFFVSVRTTSTLDSSAASVPQSVLLTVAVAFTIFPIYGSWSPFEFESLDARTAVRQFVDRMLQPLGSASRGDFAANVLIAIPITFFWHACLCTGVRHVVTRSVLSVGIVAATIALALFVEFGQMWVPSRIPTQSDVLAQSLGAVIGAAAWWLIGPRVLFWAGRLLHQRGAHDRSTAILEVYLFAYVAYALLPLDLTLRPGDLLDKFQEGSIHLIPFAADSQKTADRWIIDILLTVPVGLLLARWVQPAGRAIVGALFFCVALEMLQLAVMSRQSDTTDILTGFCGASLGVLAAHERWFERLFARRLRWEWLLLLLALYSGYVIYHLCVPFTWVEQPSLVDERLRGLLRWPLASLIDSPPFVMMTQVFRKTLLFLPFGMLAICGDRTNEKPGRGTQFFWQSLGSPRSLTCVVVAVLLAFAVEIGQVWLQPHVPDFTDSLLYLTGTAMGAAATSWALSAPESSPPHR